MKDFFSEIEVFRKEEAMYVISQISDSKERLKTLKITVDD